MTSAFVSKSRKVRFDLTLRILDLNNVPLVSGTSAITWHLPSSTAAEHRGRTQKCAIKDHRVHYEYEKVIPVRLVVSKDGMLQECSVLFQVEQEYSAGGRAERINLGQVRLNLAEYVKDPEPQTPGATGGEGGENGITRRYLMQESKINSTLKIGIAMRHLEGTRDYYAPPLKTAPVFGGIAGLISASEPVTAAHGINQTDGEGPTDGALPNVMVATKELGEMQDMYRRTLSAFWSSLPGELKADECIEDIFAGGDGWGKHGRPHSFHFGHHNSSKAPPLADATSPSHDSSKSPKPGHARRNSPSGIDKHRHIFSHRSHAPRRGMGEVDEGETLEDTVGWQIREHAFA